MIAPTVDLDPLAPETISNPYAAYEAIRRAGRAVWSVRLDSWVVAGLEDVREILRTPRVFASDPRRCGVKLPTTLLSLQVLDPPEHTPLRRAVTKAMHMQDLCLLARETRAAASERLRARRPGACELLAHVIEPTALEAISAFFGVDRPQETWFLPDAKAIVNAMDSGLNPDYLEPGLAARERLSSWIRACLRPGVHRDGGLVADLVRTVPNGVDEDLLVNTLRVIFHSGFESTSRFVGLSLSLAMSELGGLSGMSDDDLSAALSKTLRLDPVVQAEARCCVATRTIGDVIIQPGDVVTVLLGGANREPTSADWPRSEASGRTMERHISFGHGPHACPGSDYAMTQALAILSAVRDTCPDCRLLAAPVPLPNATLRGLAEIWVSLGVGP